VAPVIVVQVAPLSLLRCQTMLGVGFPLTAIEKLAVPPEYIVWLVGWDMMAGDAKGALG
jgi:hypothetical protein